MRRGLRVVECAVGGRMWCPEVRGKRGELEIPDFRTDETPTQPQGVDRTVGEAPVSETFRRRVQE